VTTSELSCMKLSAPMTGSTTQRPPHEPKIVGPHFRRLLARMRKFADRSLTILVHGATGTGKELLLQAYMDARKERAKRDKRPPEQPLIFNCAAVPPELIDSELFGAEQGAYTGATRRREGLIAGKSCLAFDELGAASSDFQVRLLRLMEEGTYRRVGGSQLEESKAIILAATNRIENVRVDLAWRFDTHIRVPSLWERRQDLIEVLAHVGQQLGITGFTERCLAFLLGCGWLGNVREVRFLLRQAVETAGQAPIDLDQLSCRVKKEWADAPRGATWALDDQFVEQVARKFPRAPDLPPDDEVIRARDVVDYAKFLPPAPPMSDDLFRQNLLNHLCHLADAAQRLADGNTRAVAEIAALATPHAAADEAKRIWYAWRLQQRRSPEEMAREGGVTPTHVRNELVKYGLRQRRTRKGR
jgi:DNA-binding NtrC family response regulator